MDSEEIYNLLRNDPNTKNCFIGVYGLDQIPLRSIKYPCCLVVNNQPSNLSGEHWLVIAKDENNYGYFFDSYGNPPKHEELLTCLGFCDDWSYNTRHLQSLFSTTCGQYCVYYILHHSKGFSSQQIIDSLDQGDLETNDGYVNFWMKQRYSGFNSPIADFPFIAKQLSRRDRWNGFV